MKRSHFILPAIVAACLLCLYSPPADASPTHVHASATPREAIQQAYAQRLNAAKRRDFATALGFYTPDYHSVSVNGTRGNLGTVKKRMNALTTAVMKTYIYTTVYTVEKCSAVGNVATVRVHYVTRETNLPTPKRLLSYSTEFSKAKDQWTLSGGRWLQKSSVALSTRITHSRTPISSP